MGMPVTIEILGPGVSKDIFRQVYSYFEYIDLKFSPFKKDSELSQINQGILTPEKYSADMKKVLKLCEETKQLTDGNFDIKIGNRLDTSGLVKGWAIWQAAKIIQKTGLMNFYVEAGGDIQTQGLNASGKPWQVGIRNPFKKEQIIKVLTLSGVGIATSGNYERGVHIINPKTGQPADEIASLTVIGPNIYEADRFATAAFAMGEKGISFIENLPEFEGYMVKKDGMAVSTSRFSKYESC